MKRVLSRLVLLGTLGLVTAGAIASHSRARDNYTAVALGLTQSADADAVKFIRRQTFFNSFVAVMGGSVMGALAFALLGEKKRITITPLSQSSLDALERQINLFERWKSASLVGDVDQLGEIAMEVEDAHRN